MEDLESLAALVLRLGGGLVFIGHGIPKLFTVRARPDMSIAHLQNSIATMGFPYPCLFAYVVAASEVVCGVLLMLGIFSRWVAFVLVVQMLVATYWVHRKRGFLQGSDFPFALLCMMLALMLIGDGRFSIGAFFP